MSLNPHISQFIIRIFHCTLTANILLLHPHAYTHTEKNISFKIFTFRIVKCIIPASFATDRVECQSQRQLNCAQNHTFAAVQERSCILLYEYMTRIMIIKMVNHYFPLIEL